VPDQLAQFPGRRRCDPRLGQTPHPQQVAQVDRIPEVVLHPSVLEGLHTQRVSQVRARAALGQGVGRPVPAVGRLDDDLGVLPGPGHRLGQGQR